MAKNTTSHSIRNDACDKVKEYIYRVYGDSKVSTSVSPLINAMIEIFDYDRDKNKLIKQLKEAQDNDGRKTRHTEATKQVEEKPVPKKKVAKKKKTKSSTDRLLEATKKFSAGRK